MQIWLRIGFDFQQVERIVDAACGFKKQDAHEFSVVCVAATIWFWLRVGSVTVYQVFTLLFLLICILWWIILWFDIQFNHEVTDNSCMFTFFFLSLYDVMNFIVIFMPCYFTAMMVSFRNHWKLIGICFLE